MNDADFLHAFETASLPRPEWTHEAHIRMAYLYLRDNRDAVAVLPQVRERIQFYNTAYGNRTGYHETITAGFLALVADSLRKRSCATFAEFREVNPELFVGTAALRPHYSDAVLFSPEARAQFVEPDGQPLPV